MEVPHGWPAPLDLAGLILIALLLVLGLSRGLWWQVIRLIGVATAVLVARALALPLASPVQAIFPELTPRFVHGIAWGTLFLLTLFASALLGLLGQRMLEAMKLDLANRVAGACAGVATGVLVHIALVVLFCQLAPAPVLGKYVAGTYSERIYAAVGLRWPLVQAAEAGAQVDQVLEQSPKHVHSRRGLVR